MRTSFIYAVDDRDHDAYSTIEVEFREAPFVDGSGAPSVEREVIGATYYQSFWRAHGVPVAAQMRCDLPENVLRLLDRWAQEWAMEHDEMLLDLARYETPRACGV